ncbi:MAG: glycosyltransferase family 4 protein [Thermoanaerobaculia bacterium]
MTWRRLQGDVEGIFWQATAPARARLRRLRAVLARARWRWSRRSGTTPFRIVSSLGHDPAPALVPPAIGVTFAPGADRPAWEQLLAAQTESSWGIAGEDRRSAWSLTLAGAPSAGLPGTALEMLLLAGESTHLDWVGSSGSELLLLRQPGTDAEPRSRLGRWIARAPQAPGTPHREPWTVAGDLCLVGSAPGGLVHRSPRELSGRLPRHPADGRRTALILLPFLAVGGAERLLLDFLAGVAGRRRLLVVTTEPYRPELGCRHAEVANLAPVFALGDLLPRERQLDAVAALIERYAVDVVACWNGCTLFYEAAGALRRRFPGVRLVHQLFDHRIGWIRRLTPAHRAAIDCHIAINQPIAHELEHSRGVPRDRIAIVRHGIAPPPAETADRRRTLRTELGITDRTPLVASFIRLHEQKRPLDILRVARRFTPDEAHFLLVGGGPLDGAIDAELEREPIPHLSRRNLESHPERWFDAVDICLMTSEHEGLPLFLLEGMAHGRPAVATAVGEIPELLKTGGGRLAPPGDIAGLARGLRELLAPQARREAGEAARRTVAERHSLQRFVAETEAAIFDGDSR